MQHTPEHILSNINRLSSAQRELVYQVALALAVELNDAPLTDHISRALAHEAHLRELDGKRAASGNSRAEYEPETQALDESVAHSLTGLRDIIRGHVKGNDLDPEAQEKGRELMRAIFPRGVAPITRLPYVDQARAVEDIVHKLQSEFAGHVAVLGLGRRVASLAALVARYIDAVRRSRAYVLAAEVKAADDRGHRFMLEVVCRVLGVTFDSDNPDHVSNRARVLDVLYHQMELNRGRRVARRRAKAGDAGDAGDVDVPAGAGDVAGDTDATGHADADATTDVSAG